MSLSIPPPRIRCVCPMDVTLFTTPTADGDRGVGPDVGPDP